MWSTAAVYFYEIVLVSPARKLSPILDFFVLQPMSKSYTCKSLDKCFVPVVPFHYLDTWALCYVWKTPNEILPWEVSMAWHGLQIHIGGLSFFPGEEFCFYSREKELPLPSQPKTLSVNLSALCLKHWHVFPVCWFWIFPSPVLPPPARTVKCMIQF